MNQLKRIIGSAGSARRCRTRVGSACEPLEARVLLTTFTVVNANNSGPGSLRRAITDANASAGADVIVFSGAVFTDAVPDIIQLTTGRLTVSDSVHIVGPGAGLLSISASGQSQLMFISGASTSVTLEGMTLSDGNAKGTTLATGSGGAIYNDNSDLTLREVVLTRNAATADGGGLYNHAGTVHVIDSVISGNSAVRGAGGLGTNGTMHVTGSSFWGNQASFGGALAVGATGQLDLNHSSFSNNSASMDGSAVFNHYGSATLSHLTLTENTSVRGGPVTNWGTMLILDSTFFANHAELGAGAGNALGGTMVVVRCEFADNVSTRDGGGLFNGTGGHLTVIDSTFARNVSTLVGGGLANARDGKVLVMNSTFTENGSDLGGGIANIHDGEMSIINSTISGNFSYGAGGGVFNDGVLTLTNATIVGNRSDRDGNGNGGGGGLFTNTEPQVITRMFNTLVAGNFKGTPSSQTGNDVGGKAVAGPSAYNLIGTPGFAGGLVHGANGNIVGQAGAGGARVNLQAASVVNLTLADNGGPTRTHALVAGSIAIDAGNNALAIDSAGLPLSGDQRGMSRISGPRVDIGAYEVQAAG